MGRKVGLCAFVYRTTSGDEAHAPMDTRKKNVENRYGTKN